MDMFMDKLAQKLTAQEIIKANTAADTEEMNKLKNQIAEYNECLLRLKTLLEDGEAALRSSKEDSKTAACLVEESIKKIQDIQSEIAGLKALEERLERLEIDNLERKKNTEYLAETFGELEKNVQDKLAAASTAMDENVHKECVKVYRNVQAVVVEESGKQTKAEEETRSAVTAAGGKIGVVLGISVAALFFSLAGVVLQILNALNISLF